MNREGIIAVCLAALVLTPISIWLHVQLSKVGERNIVIGWLAMATFLLAWLMAIAFFLTLVLLGASMFVRAG